MLKLEIKGHQDLPKELSLNSIIDTIVDCAIANGTSAFHRERLLELFKKYSLKKDDCYHIKLQKSFANREYTKGLYAVLYLIDCTDNMVAYTTPNLDNWFSIRISDPKKLIAYLEDKVSISSNK